MPDKKLTDNEIIKALECCADEMGCTKGCPCFNPKAKGSHCTVAKKLELEKLTIDLINRLQAENEELQLKIASCNTENMRLKEINDSFTAIGKLYSEIKAEAYKELINILESRLIYKLNITAIGYEVAIIELKNLLKELVGEKQ